MENQPIISSSDISPTSPALINQSSLPPQPKMNLIVPILLTILLSGTVFGFGGYYFAKKTINSQPNLEDNQIQPTSTTISQMLATPTTIKEQLSTLPAGWSYKTNNECGVKFAIPPKEKPYYQPIDPNREPSVTNDQGSGRFWDFPRGGSYPNLLSKLIGEKQEYKQAIAMFASADGGSGYISQAVAVSCIPNNGRFTDNSQLLSSLTTELNKYNSLTGEKGMQAATYSVKSNSPTQRWSKNVVDLVVAEDTANISYTMFVTSQFIYEVKLFGGSKDISVKNTGKQIFDNLSF